MSAAGDIWHDADVADRQRVRNTWPLLASALDHETPTEFQTGENR